MNKKQYYDLDGQAERSKKMYALFAQSHIGQVDENGNFTDSRIIHSNQKIFQAAARFKSGIKEAADEANRILENKPAIEFDHFSPTRLLFILREFKPLLTKKAEDYIMNYLSTYLDDFKSSELDFVGVNDNFPCSAAYAMIIGSEVFKRDDYYIAGYNRLCQLRDMLIRRGVASEYNTPSYSMIQISMLAALAEHAPNDEIRDMALDCEARIWLDALAHYYPETSRLCGPHSRTYMSGLTSPVNIPQSFYLLLGSKLSILPGEAPLSAETVDQYVNENTICTLHCPKHIVEWALKREYPFRFAATTEYNSSTDALPNGPHRGTYDGKPITGANISRNPYAEDDTYEYPSGSGVISTYMTKNYALGVSTCNFHSGNQTESFFATYVKAPPARSQKDVKVIFSRYVVNGRRIGEPTEFPELGIKNSPFMFWDCGRKIGVHKDNRAMILYKPRNFLKHDVTELKLSVYIYSPGADPDEIWLGDKPAADCGNQSRDTCPVFVRDGDMFMALHPMCYTDYGRNYAVDVERVNDFIAISFYNYQGSSVSFKERGFLLTANGFAAEFGSPAENGDFESFRKSCAKSCVCDELLTNPHVRQTYTRKSKFTAGGDTLECEYSPVSEGIRYIAINGIPHCIDRIKADGLNNKDIPLLG